MDEDEPSCGKGLAEHSVVPLKLGELIAALADNLEQHMPSLTEVDPATRAEHAAYTRLAEQHREIATRLREVGSEMASYRDLAMGAHDEQALATPEVIAAFQQYMATLRQTIATLQASLAADEQLLGQVPQFAPV